MNDTQRNKWALEQRPAPRTVEDGSVSSGKDPPGASPLVLVGVLKGVALAGRHYPVSEHRCRLHCLVEVDTTDSMAAELVVAFRGFVVVEAGPSHKSLSSVAFFSIVGLVADILLLLIQFIKST